MAKGGMPLLASIAKPRRDTRSKEAEVAVCVEVLKGQRVGADQVAVIRGAARSEPALSRETCLDENAAQPQSGTPVDADFQLSNRQKCVAGHLGARRRPATVLNLKGLLTG